MVRGVESRVKYCSDRAVVDTRSSSITLECPSTLSNRTGRDGERTGWPEIRRFRERGRGVFASDQALCREPGVKSRRHEAVRSVELACRARRQRIGVLVLRLAVVASNPLPFHLVRPHELDRLSPQIQVLDLAALPSPSPFDPAEDPLAHALHEVLRVAREADSESLALSGDEAECVDHAPERHAVV